MGDYTSAMARAGRVNRWTLAEWPRVPGLRWKMYLVSNGSDDYKFCSERHNGEVQTRP